MDCFERICIYDLIWKETQVNGVTLCSEITTSDAKSYRIDTAMIIRVFVLSQLRILYILHIIHISCMYHSLMNNYVMIMKHWHCIRIP